MPELRKDPIIGRWVIISTERGKRPMDFEREKKEAAGGFCPFCRGNEDKTPPEVLAFREPLSAPNAPGWKVRVVPNKFPALQIEGELDKRGNGIYDMMRGVGAHEVLIEMTGKRLGHTCVVDSEGRLQGIITDGDLRRSLERGFDLGAVIASDLMTRNPKNIGEDDLAAAAVNRMEHHKITLLVIVGEDGRPRGVVHLHDLLRAKVV